MLIGNRLFFEQVEAVLATGSEVKFLLRGHSMRPLMHDGRDTLVVAPVADHEIRCGAILLFRYHDRHILHRVIRRRGDQLVMAGDGNYHLKECCSTADVVGRLVRVQRKSGKVIACDSCGWRVRSAMWLMLPAIVRRILLGAMRHLGIG